MYRRYLKIGLVYFMDQSRVNDLSYPELVEMRSKPVSQNDLIDPAVKLLNELVTELGDRLGREHGTYVVYSYSNSFSHMDLATQYVFDIHATDGLLNVIVDPDQRWQLFKIPSEWADKPELIEKHFYNALLTLIGVSADDGTVETTPEDL